MTAVGWNCSSSRSARSAPAWWASSRPTPCDPGGLVVRAHIAAAPPVLSTTARAATICPSSQISPAQRSPERHSARARAPSSTVMRGSAATSADSWRTTRRPVALPPACTTRRTECPPSRPSASCPERSASKRTPSACRSRTQSGASRTRISAAERLHEAAPGQLGVAQVQLGAVVGCERRGETALRPVAGRLRERRRGDEHDRRVLARCAKRRVEPGGACADDCYVGLTRDRQ